MTPSTVDRYWSTPYRVRPARLFLWMTISGTVGGTLAGASTRGRDSEASGSVTAAWRMRPSCSARGGGLHPATTLTPTPLSKTTNSERP